jgi:hypothetical protein
MWKSFKRDVDIAMGATVYRNEIIEHMLPEEVTPYYLRHTCCTEWFEMGLDLKTVQYLMGHADIKTTANVYMHFTERSVAKAGDIIRGYLAMPYKWLNYKVYICILEIDVQRVRGSSPLAPTIIGRHL